MPYNSLISRGTDPSYSTSANESNPLIPVEVQRGIIQGMTEKSAVMRLMKTMRMSRHLKQMPVLNSLPTAYWVTDPTGLKQTSEMDWRNVMLTAEELAVLIPIPDVVLADADYDIWSEIRPKVEEAFGKALDEAVLFGINTPSSWGSSIKSLASTASNTVTIGTGVDIAADMNNALAAVEADGYGPNAIAMRQDLRASFRGLRSTTNEFVFKPGEAGAENSRFGSGNNAVEGSIFDIRALAIRNGSFESENTATSNSVSAIAGDFSQGIIAVREDISVDFSKSAVIHDNTGAIQYNAWQQDLTIGRFVARFAFAVPNPVNRTRETTSARYPFALLRDSA
mgnify:FL=1